MKNEEYHQKINTDFFRFHLPHVHIHSVYGDDWFSRQAEKFAKFFGTPVFLVAQTLVVSVWILFNVIGIWHFDIYPFVFLNLAFSLQAAYAAPLILLAQTRQADRDKLHAIADAEHRESIYKSNDETLQLSVKQNEMIVEMLKQNTEITEKIKNLTEKIESLTKDIHGNIVVVNS